MCWAKKRALRRGIELLGAANVYDCDPLIRASDSVHSWDGHFSDFLWPRAWLGVPVPKVARRHRDQSVPMPFGGNVSVVSGARGTAGFAVGTRAGELGIAGPAVGVAVAGLGIAGSAVGVAVVELGAVEAAAGAVSVGLVGSAVPRCAVRRMRGILAVACIELHAVVAVGVLSGVLPR